MSTHGRSRSPLRSDYMRISRALACFGRYPSTCPPGLNIDGTGCMRLDDIMHYWGERKGLRERDVLDAVRSNMFREHDHGGSLRFAIDGDENGRVLIRVRPKQGLQEHNRSRVSRVPSRPPSCRSPQADKMVGNENSNTTNSSANNADLSELSLDDKLDMSLDDLVAAAQATRSTSGAGDSGASEKVSCWISWVLASGHRELGITIAVGGWAQLQELAASIAVRMLHFGEFDGSKLKCFIEETDLDGRFEISSTGWLRKVPKRNRSPRRPQTFVVDRNRMIAEMSKSATAGTSLSAGPFAKVEQAGLLEVKEPSSPSSTRSGLRRPSRSPSRSASVEYVGSFSQACKQEP
ncbi:unnamed protein product [Polarella glacialis]|uniref:Uncharacterized protein n=1 Tax=Polarella glacialis TaxID=89957 RepID=A0A813DK36_POLGL|nr:unnamed protein product [Polarella glacialis]